MSALFYASGAIAVFAAIMVVTRSNAMHAVINLVVVFLAIAGVMFSLGAPFVAVLQIVIYAGAIIVLFVFVVMMLNLGARDQERERNRLRGLVWVMPALLAVGLLIVLGISLALPRSGGFAIRPAIAYVGPKIVGISLYTDYLIGVEVASILLLAGLVAAFHFGVLPTRVNLGDEDDTD